jgi:hypothetical protein
MNLIGFTKQAASFRAWFAVSRGGTLRTGLASGVFTATFVDLDDSATATYTVNESAQKPGLYYFDIPSSFLVTNGVGEYVAVVEVNASGPALKAVASGTLQVTEEDITGLSDLAYGDGVVVDTKNGTAGTAYPKGTYADPVSNLADALTIAGNYNRRKFYLRGNITLTAALSDWVVAGIGEEAAVTLAGQDVSDSEFANVVLSGNLGGGPIRAVDCTLDGVGNMEGTATGCAITAGGMNLAGDTRLVNCSSAVPGTATPFVDINGTARSLELRHYAGGIEIRNLTDVGGNVSIHQVAGQVVIAASCTAGTIAVRGVGNLTDNSGAGCNVVDTAHLDRLRIADAIWDEAIQEHIATGSAGEALLAAFAQAGGHVRDDALTYDGNDRPTAFRRRVFPDAATAAASTAGATGEGEIMTFTVSAAHISAEQWQTLLRRRTS